MPSQAGRRVTRTPHAVGALTDNLLFSLYGAIGAKRSLRVAQHCFQNTDAMLEDIGTSDERCSPSTTVLGSNPYRQDASSSGFGAGEELAPVRRCTYARASRSSAALASGWKVISTTRKRRLRPSGNGQLMDSPSASPSNAVPTGANTDTFPREASAS